MLIIRRRLGEAILVGSDIEIEVVDITPGRVRLGIRAPDRIPILRKEVHLTAINNREAARTVSPDALEHLVSRLRHANFLHPR
jgi:carbon storage regulator